jgi:phenylalanyl-tRNA synthetase alpha chain
LYARAPLITHVVPHTARCLQVEGVVADRGLGLGHLIGIITEFFNRIGITQLR